MEEKRERGWKGGGRGEERMERKGRGEGERLRRGKRKRWEGEK